MTLLNATGFVRKLTATDRDRRIPGALANALLLLCPCSGIAAPETEWQVIEDIAAVAETHIAERFGKAEADTSVRAGMLDERMRLASCDRPLTAFLRRGTRIGPRTTVGVRCDGTRPWTVYVPVEVFVVKAVWVASKPLPRGHVLQPGDLSTDRRDVSGMVGGYISEKRSLVGQKLRTSILAGRAITPSLIEADDIVHRGQTVTLAVSNGGLSIQMAGKALSDGALNQRIRVENLNSGRIIEGIVRSRETVEVLVQ